LAERQARAAIALVRVGKAEGAYPLLRHSRDPRLRSFIMNWLNPLGADPKALVAELDRLDSGRRGTDILPMPLSGHGLEARATSSAGRGSPDHCGEHLGSDEKRLKTRGLLVGGRPPTNSFGDRDP